MKSKGKQTLTPRQMQVMPHLLSCPSYEEAARLSKISPKQIYSWLKQPEFQDELKKQRNTIFCEALASLKTAVKRAVQTLIILLDDKDPRIRLLASEKILLNTFKGVEFLGIEERIKALEELSEKASQKGSFGANT